jgi:hypothetical protein
MAVPERFGSLRTKVGRFKMYTYYEASSFVALTQGISLFTRLTCECVAHRISNVNENGSG